MNILSVGHNSQTRDVFTMRKTRLLSQAEVNELLACPVMRVRQAERVFKVNRNRLYAMMADGTLPYVQLGASRLIRTATLQALTTPVEAAE
ncbi:MAG: hypothetical protein WA231_17480 [Methylocella sp.]